MEIEIPCQDHTTQISKERIETESWHRVQLRRFRYDDVTEMTSGQV